MTFRTTLILYNPNKTIFCCLLKIKSEGARHTHLGGLFQNHEDATEKPLSFVPSKQASLVDETVRTASPCDLIPCIERYGKRQFLR